MDPLRVGPLTDDRSRWILEGIVSGVSGYGNAVGVPTVGGEVVCDDTYTGNPLVNVLCLGILPADRLVLGRASGVGNLAVLLGNATGRDGIGGASVLASAGFGEGPEEQAKRPSVQVGDPFEEKRLIEACLALLDARLVVASRTSAPPACPARPVRPPAVAASGWTSTSTASPSGRRGWSPSR
jgi:phosphoribosylformylglycinamidine synthase